MLKTDTADSLSLTAIERLNVQFVGAYVNETRRHRAAYARVHLRCRDQEIAGRLTKCLGCFAKGRKLQ